MLTLTLATLALAGPTELELAAGAAVRASDDPMFSDRVYTGASPIHGGLAVRHDAGGLRNEIEAAFDLTRVRTGPSYSWRWNDDDPLTPLPGSPFVRVDLAWQLGAPVIEGPVDVHVGAAWRNRVDARNHDYGQVGVFGYVGLFGVGPYVRVASDKGRWSAAAELDVMALGWGTRSPYGLNDAPYIQASRDHNGVKTFFDHVGRGRPVTAVSTQYVAVQGGITRALSDRWSASARVDVQLLTERNPEPLVDLVVTPRLAISPRL